MYNCKKPGNFTDIYVTTKKAEELYHIKKFKQIKQWKVPGVIKNRISKYIQWDLIYPNPYDLNHSDNYMLM